MVIDISLMLILGIIFTGLSVTDRALALMKDKGVIKKLHKYVRSNKEKVEKSIKENRLMEDPEIVSIKTEIKSILDESLEDNLQFEPVIDVSEKMIELVNISKLFI